MPDPSTSDPHPPPDPIQATLDERGKRYGEFPMHARITQGIKDAVRIGPGWDRCDDALREALDMIAHKMGRIANGDPWYEDSWVDLIGYATLALQQVAKVNAKGTE